jgi:hypothetical protein
MDSSLNVTYFFKANCLDSVGSSTPHNRIGLHGMLRGKFYFLLNPSSHTMALGFTQPLKRISIRRYFWGKEQLVCRADNPTTVCVLTSRYVRSLTSHTLIGLCGLSDGELYFYVFSFKEAMCIQSLLDCDFKL